MPNPKKPTPKSQRQISNEQVNPYINPETGVLTWNPATFTGTYIFTVTVTNEKGCVFGQEIITLIVDCPEEG